MVARFLLDKNRFSRENRRVKPKAFEPAPDNRVSVFCVDGLSEENVWSLGDTHVAGPLGKDLLARAELTQAEIESLDPLRLDRDDNPFRHANITGWPEEKDKKKSMAQELAARATLKVRTQAG